MYCENCGASIEAVSKFCANCGNSLAEGLVAQRSARSYASRRGSKKLPKKFSVFLIVSIPAIFILLVVAWFLTGIVGDRREGFEKFLPDSTVFYTEIYDPIGFILDLEKSLFWRKVTATQSWKEIEKSEKSLRNYKDTLARMAALRGSVGPLGVAFIPSFAEAPLSYLRVKKDYAGAVKTGLEKFLESQGVKFRQSQQAGRIRYDLETGYSNVIMDFGLLGGPSMLVDKYIDWINNHSEANLSRTNNFKKVVSSPGGATFARVFTHSAILQSAIGKVTDPATLKALQNFPEWISSTDLEFNNGLFLKSATLLNDKRFTEASKKPISNRSIKYLPRDAVFVVTLNLPLVVEFAKDEIRRSGVEGRERQVEKLLETLQGEGLFALVPDSRGQLSDDRFLVAVEQKQPSASAKALGELIREMGEQPQVQRYGAREITCYSGPPLCYSEIEDFLFLSTGRELIQRVADVEAGKAAGFQDSVKSDETLKKFFASKNSHGVVYMDIKAVLTSADLNWEGAREFRLKERVRTISKPFYMAGASYLRGDVFEGQALLSADFSEFGDLLIEWAEREFLPHRARGVDAEMQSDLRHAATVQEAFFAQNNRYATRVEELRGYNPTPGVVLNIDYADAGRFVLTASKPGGTASSYYFDSQTGQIAPGSGAGKTITRRAPPAPPVAQHSNLRSLESRIQSEMIFENRLREPVLISWVDFQGKEVLYKDLDPGMAHIQQTYVTHPWRVRIKRTHQLVKELVANSQREVVVIQ